MFLRRKRARQLRIVCILMLCAVATVLFVSGILDILVPKAPPQYRQDEPCAQEQDNNPKVYFIHWSQFRGYNSRRVTSETHIPDPLLLQRILKSQELVKTPLIRLVVNNSVIRRHEWQFEKIIHQSWLGEDIPGLSEPWVKRWQELHPDWTYMFWTDSSALTFIERYFPSLEPIYNSYTIPVQKADFFRYIVIYAFGGVWADLDLEPLKPLDEIRNWSSCILSREPDLQTYVMANNLNCWGNNWTFTCNAFFACRSHHPFMHYVISRVVQTSPLVLRRRCTLPLTLECTGPTLLSLSYGFYRRSLPESLRQQHRQYDVISPRYEYFLPTFDPSRRGKVQYVCNVKYPRGRAKTACEQYKTRGQKNEPLNYSFTNHHWFHSYHQNVKKDTISIRHVTEPVLWPDSSETIDYDVCWL